MDIDSETENERIIERASKYQSISQGTMSGTEYERDPGIVFQNSISYIKKHQVKSDPRNAPDAPNL